MGKRRIVWKLCLFLLCALLMVTYTAVVHATEEIENEVDEENEDRFSQGSPWLEGVDDSIYSNGIDTAEEDQEIEPDKPGIVEKYFSELLRNTASSLISLLEDTLGAGLDSIIYGRVGSGKPNSVNIFGFELRSGNPYGVTAAVCYALIRSMVFVFLGIAFVAMLAKSLWTGHTAQSREQIKSGIFSVAMKFCMLTLMPYLFDVVLYIRDVALYGVMEVTGEMVTGGATLSLSTAFLTNAERSGRFVDAVMYLGTVFLTIYFAVIYIGLAISILVAFISFPIMCLFHSQKRNLLDNWAMNVLSCIITPLLDAILLLVPLLASMMLGDVIRGIAVIQMVMCMLIIPARNEIKRYLGIPGNDRSGFLSAMGLFAMGRMIAGKAKGALQRLSGIRSDWQKGRMHDEMARIDEEEQESLLGDVGRQGQEGRDIRDMDEEGQTGEHPDRQEDLKELGGDAGGAPDMADLEADGLTGEETEPMGSMDAPETDTGIPGQDGESLEAMDAAGEGMPENAVDEDGPMTRNEALRNLGREMDTMQEKIDGLRVRKAGYQSREKQLAREMLDYDRDSDEYRDLEKDRAEAAAGAAETAQKIEDQSRKLNQLRQQEKELRGSGKGPVPTPFDKARARVLCKRANIDNFEQPEFRGVLSNEQMAKLYRKRMWANIGKGAAAAAGGTAGAVILGGGSVFLGQGAVQMGTVAGAIAGSAVADTAVGAGIAGTRALYSARHTITGHHAGPSAPPVSPVGTIAPEAGTAHAPSEPPEPVMPQTPGTAAGGSTVVPPVAGQAQPAAREVVVEEQAAPDGAADEMYGTWAEAPKKKIQIEIEKDSASAIQQVLSPTGGLRNSSAVRALQQGNIETEKYILAAKELEGTVLTRQQELAKRTEFQTEKLTDEIMLRLSHNPEYEPGSENYAAARASVSEKVRAIIERQNRDLF